MMFVHVIIMAAGMRVKCLNIICVNYELTTFIWINIHSFYISIEIRMKYVLSALICKLVRYRAVFQMF